MIYTLFRSWDNGRVVTFTVHESGEPASDRIDRAEELVFVKDGFHFFAALFAPVWLVMRGLWLAFAGYLALAVAIGGGLYLAGASEFWIVLAILMLNVLVGAEADTIQRLSLDQQGWQTIGTVVGRNANECERRFFDTWLPQQPVLRRAGSEGVAGYSVQGSQIHSSQPHGVQGASVASMSGGTESTAAVVKPSRRRWWRLFRS